MRGFQPAGSVNGVSGANPLRHRSVDPETGMPSARFAEGLLAEWFSTSRWARARVCSVAKFEIDGFGGYVRRQDEEELRLAPFVIGLVLKGHAHRNAAVGRYPGGGFIVVLPGVGLRRALTFSKQVAWDVASQFSDHDSPVTVSGGVAGQDGSITHPRQLLELADSALRAAKWQGGNRVEVGNLESQWLPQRSWLEAVRFMRSA